MEARSLDEGAVGETGEQGLALVKQLQFLNFPLLASVSPAEKSGWIKNLAQVPTACDSVTV